MRKTLLAVISTAVASLAWAGDAGPFQTTPRIYDPAHPTPDQVAADGTIESATLVSGSAAAGIIDCESWSSDRMSGSSGAFGGNTLRGAPSTNYFVGLTTRWAIREGVEFGGEYFYYHRFQQDLHWHAGWADVSSAPLPTRFHLDEAVPYNRLVVSAPLRWIQGGGSTFQVGAYNGNPPQAGVFWIPSGLSLQQAEANPANRLCDLGSVLKEFQPHLHAWSVKLQPGGDSGHWDLRIDIDNDGQVDVDLNSEMPGNRPAPGSMSEASGLIVTTTNAGGNPTGTVGRTSMEVSYRASPSETIVSPLNRRPLLGSIPTSSPVSPVKIDVQRWTSAWAVTATSNGTALPVSPIGDHALVDVSLDPDSFKKTPVTITQAGGTDLSGGIYWSPTNLYHTSTITVLRGSSILLTFDGNCGPEDLTIDADDGAAIRHFSGRSSDTFQVTYNVAGTFVATAIADGKPAGTLTVSVVDVRFPSRIVCSVGYERPVVVDTGANPGTGLSFTSSDPLALSVGVAQIAGSHVALKVKPIQPRAQPALIIAHLGAANGPVAGNGVKLTRKPM